MTERCVFCGIIDGREPAEFVGKWADTVAFRPLGPVVDGHILVVPRRHVADATTEPYTYGIVSARAALLAAEHDSANIITSIGAAATQSIHHLHVHVVPRTKDDGLMVPWGTVYGDDPQAPHWCRVAADLNERVQVLTQDRV